MQKHACLPLYFAFALVSIHQAQVAHAAQGSEIKPEKNSLEVAIAATGPLYLPIMLAAEAGYFSKRASR